jgi:glycosyl transferase family 25
MPTPLLLINLDRSKDRLAAVEASAAGLGLRITRVPAIDGSTLTAEQRSLIDEARFHQICGKTVLTAEIGCYLSHLRAIRHIAEGEDEIGVVLEDDVQFTADFSAVIDELACIKGWDVVKLVNHRTTAFLRRLPLGNGYALGRCIHGSLGSAAAYAVRRDAARRLVTSLRPMVMQFDVELERGWAHGTALFTLDKPLVKLTRAPSVIEGSGLRRIKFPLRRRWRTGIFRTLNYFRCAAYALTPSALTRTIDVPPRG